MLFAHDAHAFSAWQRWNFYRSEFTLFISPSLLIFRSVGLIIAIDAPCGLHFNFVRHLRSRLLLLYSFTTWSITMDPTKKKRKTKRIARDLAEYLHPNSSDSSARAQEHVHFSIPFFFSCINSNQHKYIFDEPPNVYNYADKNYNSLLCSWWLLFSLVFCCLHIRFVKQIVYIRKYNLVIPTSPTYMRSYILTKLKIHTYRLWSERASWLLQLAVSATSQPMRI